MGVRLGLLWLRRAGRKPTERKGACCPTLQRPCVQHPSPTSPPSGQWEPTAYAGKPRAIGLQLCQCVSAHTTAPIMHLAQYLPSIAKQAPPTTAPQETDRNLVPLSLHQHPGWPSLASGSSLLSQLPKPCPPLTPRTRPSWPLASWAGEQAPRAQPDLVQMRRPPDSGLP